MSAPNDQPASSSGSPSAERRGGGVDRGLHVEQLAAAFVVGAGAALDAAEVEAQAGEPGGGQGVEQRADHDRAHGAAVLRMGVAQHDRRPARAVRGGALGFQADAVGGGEGQATARPSRHDA